MLNTGCAKVEILSSQVCTSVKPAGSRVVFCVLRVLSVLYIVLSVLQESKKIAIYMQVDVGFS